MINKKKEMILSTGKCLWKSMVFSGVFWVSYFVISKMLNISDFSNTFTPWMYCSLVFASAIAWAVRFYYMEKKIKSKFEDWSLAKIILIEFGASLITTILLWAGFCLLAQVIPVGVVPFARLLVMTTFVIEMLINIRTVIVIGVEEIKDYVLYLLGFEEDNDDY